MKNRMILSALALTMICSCGQKENLVTGQGPQQTVAADGLTCALVPDVKTSLDADMNVVWRADDAVKVYSASGKSAVYSTEEDNVREAVFYPSSAAVGEPAYAVYPSIAGGDLSGSVVKVDFSVLSEQSLLNVLGEGTDMSFVPMLGTFSENVMSFRNLCGGLKLQIWDYQANHLKIKTLKLKAKGVASEAGVAVSDGSFTLADSNDEIVVDFGTDGYDLTQSTYAEPAKFIMFLPAATYSSLEFEITDTEGRVMNMASSKAVTVKSGVVSPLAVRPLTLYHGKANSVVLAPGSSTAIDASAYYTFRSDYAYENLPVKTTAGNAWLPSGAKAEVVWEQAEGTSALTKGSVLSSVTLSGSNVSVVSNGTKGNALVALKDGNDNILWSWHVWVSEVNDVAYNYTGYDRFSMLDRNLGAVSVTPKDFDAFGMFYQWGRKDPFPRPIEKGRTDASTGKDSELIGNSAYGAETGVIAYTVSNPSTRIIAASDPKDWHVVRNNALWGNSVKATEEAVAVAVKGGVKTVYDPCPAGYKVPELYYYKAIASDPDNAFNKAESDGNYGYLFDTGNSADSYWPTTGFLDNAADNMTYSGYRGYVWSSVGAGDNVWYFYYNNAGVKMSYAVRAKAKAVRCLKIQ